MPVFAPYADDTTEMPPPTYGNGGLATPESDEDPLYKAATTPPDPNEAAYKAATAPPDRSDAALRLISKYESGDRNVPNFRYDPGHTAGGYYQITNTNWRNYGPRVGIDLKQHPNAMAAPQDVQARVAKLMHKERGFADWAPFNPGLAAALKRGELDTIDQQPQRPTKPLSDEEAYQQATAGAPAEPRTAAAPPVRATRQPRIDPKKLNIQQFGDQWRFDDPKTGMARYFNSREELNQAISGYGMRLKPPSLKAATAGAEGIVTAEAGYPEPRPSSVAAPPPSRNDWEQEQRQIEIAEKLKAAGAPPETSQAIIQELKRQGPGMGSVGGRLRARGYDTKAISDIIDERKPTTESMAAQAEAEAGLPAYQKAAREVLLPVAGGVARVLANTEREAAGLASGFGYYPNWISEGIKAQAQKDAAQLERTMQTVPGGGSADVPVLGKTSYKDLTSAFGESAGALAKLYIGGELLDAFGLPAAANLPIQGALSRSEEGVPGLVKGAAGGLLYHYGGSVTGPYLGKVGNGLLWVAGPAAEAHTIYGVPWKEAITQNIPFGLFAGMTGGGERARVFENGEPRNARIRDLPRIVSGELKLEPPPQPGVPQTSWVPEAVKQAARTDKPVIVTAPPLRSGEGARAAMVQRGPEGTHFLTEIAAGKTGAVAEQNKIDQQIPISPKDYNAMLRGTRAGAARTGQITVGENGRLLRRGEPTDLVLNPKTRVIERRPMRNEPEATAAPTTPVEAAALPPAKTTESKGAIRAQIEALQDGRGNRAAVVVDADTELPTIPPTLASVKTEDGRTVIYHPDRGTPEEVKELAEDPATAHLLMGHLNADNPEAARVVVARAGRDLPEIGIKAGDELMQSRVMPDNEQAMMAEMAAQFPKERYGTNIIIGGEQIIRDQATQAEPKPDRTGEPAKPLLNPRFEGQTDAQLRQAQRDLESPPPFRGKQSRAEAKAQRSRRQQRLEAIRAEITARSSLPATNPKFEALDDAGLTARQESLRSQLAAKTLPPRREQRARTELNQIAEEQSARAARNIAPQVWRHGHFGDLVADPNRSAPRGKFWAYEKNDPETYHLIDRESGLLQPTGEAAPPKAGQTITQTITDTATAPAGQLFGTAPEAEKPPEPTADQAAAAKEPVIAVKPMEKQNALRSYLGNKITMARKAAFDIIPASWRGRWKRVVDVFGGSGLHGWQIGKALGTPVHYNEYDPDVFTFQKLASTVEGQEKLRRVWLPLADEINALVNKAPKGGPEIHKEVSEWWKATQAKLTAADATPEQRAARVLMENTLGTMGNTQALMSEGHTWKKDAVNALGDVAQLLERHRLNAQAWEGMSNQRAEDLLPTLKKGDLAMLDRPYALTKGYNVGQNHESVKGATDFINDHIKPAIERGVDVIYTNAANTEIVGALRAAGMEVKLERVQTQSRGGETGARYEVVGWTPDVSPPRGTDPEVLKGWASDPSLQQAGLLSGGRTAEQEMRSYVREAKEGERPEAVSTPRTLASEPLPPPELPREKQRGTLEFGRSRIEHWRKGAIDELAKAQVKPHISARTREPETFAQTAERVLRDANKERVQSLALDVHDATDRKTLAAAYPEFTAENLKAEIEKRATELKAESVTAEATVPETTKEKATREAEQTKAERALAQSQRQAGKIPGVKRSNPARNSLAEEAAAMGGVTHDRDGSYKGEVASLAQSRVRGLVNHKSGQTLEDMAMTLMQEGYGHNTWARDPHGNGIDLNAFIEALNQDSSGARREYSTQYEVDTRALEVAEREHWLGQMTDEERAQFLQGERFLASPKVKRLLEAIENGDTSAKTTRELRAIGNRRGVDEETVNAQIRTAQKTRDSRQRQRREAAATAGQEHSESPAGTKTEGRTLTPQPEAEIRRAIRNYTAELSDKVADAPRFIREAAERLKQAKEFELKGGEYRGSGGPDTQKVLDRLMVEGWDAYRKGKTEFKEWADEMRARLHDFKNRIDPHLEKIHAQISRQADALERLRGKAPSTAREKSADLPPPIRIAPEPKEGKGLRRHVEQLEAKGFVGGTDREYDKIALREERDKARAQVSKIGLDQAISQVTSNTRIHAQDVALAQATLEKATQQAIRLETRDKTAATEMWGKVADLSATKAMQATQAAQALASNYIQDKISPEGVLVEAQRIARPMGGLTAEQTRDFTLATDRYRKLETALEEANRQINQLRSRAKGPQTSALRPPTAARPRKTGTGKAEDFVTRLETQAAQAQARIAATREQIKAGTLEFRAAGPMDPVIARHLTDYVTIGAAKMARTTLTLAEWTADMVKDFGEEIRPHLEDIRNRAARMIRDERRKDRDAAITAKATAGLPDGTSVPVIEQLKREYELRQIKQREERTALRKVEGQKRQKSPYPVEGPKELGKRETAILRGIASKAPDDAALAASAFKLSRPNIDLKAYQAEMKAAYGIEPDSPEAARLLKDGRQLADEAKKNAKEQMLLDRLAKGIPDDVTPEERDRLIEERRQARAYFAEHRRIQKRELNNKLNELSLQQRSMAGNFVRALSRNSLLSEAGFLRILTSLSSKQAFDTMARFASSPRTVTPAGEAGAVGVLLTRGLKNAGLTLLGKDSEVMRQWSGKTFENPYLEAALNYVSRQYGAKMSLWTSYAEESENQRVARVLARLDVSDGTIARKDLGSRIDQYLHESPQDHGPHARAWIESKAREAAAEELRQGAISKSYEKTRVLQLSQNVGDLMEVLKTQYGERQVGMQSSRTANTGRDITGTISRKSPAAGAIVKAGQEVYLPFLRIPANAAMDYFGSYLGGRLVFGEQELSEGDRGLRRLAKSTLSGDIYKALSRKPEFGPAEREQLKRTLSRTATNATLIMLGAVLAKNNLLDEKGNLKINGRTLNVGSVPFLGWSLVIGAGWQQRGPKGAAAALAHAIAHHPLLRAAGSLADTVGMAKDLGEGKWAAARYVATRQVGDILSRGVPHPLPDIALAEDDKERDTRGLFGPSKARIPSPLPGNRMTLPVWSDLYGHDVEKSRLSGFDAFGYFKPPARQTPLTREMAATGASIKGPRRQSWETETGYKQRQRQWGAEFEERGGTLIEDPNYQDADKTTREAMLKDLARRITAAYPPEMAPPELRRTKLTGGERQGVGAAASGLPKAPKAER